MSREGRPAADHPRTIARDLGLDVKAGPLSGFDLIDAAARAYWDRRPEQSRKALAEYRRNRIRRTTSPEVWLRRGGEAA